MSHHEARDGSEQDGPDWQQFEEDRPLREYLDAVDTVATFLGGEEGRRVRAALHSVIGWQDPPPAAQLSIPEFDGNSIPF